MKNVTCYYLLFSQKDFLQNQVIEELIRERSNYYIAENKSTDYWILNSPEFINNSELKEKIKLSSFYRAKQNEIVKNNEEYFSSILTFNKEFFVWMQLRLGDFEDINLINDNKLNDNKLKDFRVDGIKGEFILDTFDFNILKSKSNKIHPDLMLLKFSNFIEYV
jgi:hypothetical protein